jgi:hypothetical protein
MTNVLNLIDINGEIDTSKTCLDNLNTIATNSQSFLSWDPEIGKWTAKLNRPVANTATASVADFNDDNIVGAITVSGSGITDKYNAIKVTYNADDLQGDKDEIFLEIDPDERYSNELDNDLSINYSLINKSPIAERLGVIELNQSRVDKIIEFATDYRFFNIKPGELIRVTNEQYGYINKVFRVATVEEIDTEDGAILIGITALEYFSSVYDAINIIREERNKATGIIPKESNVCIYNKEIEQAADDAIDVQNELAGATLVGFLRGGFVNYSANAAPNNTVENDSSFFFTSGSTSFDPNDTTYRYDSGLSFITPRAGIYVVNWTLYLRNTLLTDGTNGLWPSLFRVRAALNYEIQGTHYAGDSLASETGLVMPATPITLQLIPLQLPKDTTINFYAQIKNDFITNHITAAQSFVDTEFKLSANVYYLGETI